MLVWLDAADTGAGGVGTAMGSGFGSGPAFRTKVRTRSILCTCNSASGVALANFTMSDSWSNRLISESCSSERSDFNSKAVLICLLVISMAGTWNRDSRNSRKILVNAL